MYLKFECEEGKEFVVYFIVLFQSIASMVVAEFQGNRTSMFVPVSPRHPTVSLAVLEIDFASLLF